MREEAQTCNARVRVRVDSCDISIWRGTHQFYLFGMPYGSGRPEVQGESHLLTDGGTERDSGMDWLSSNHIVIDCGRHNVVFPDVGGLELIWTQKAMKEIKARATCFMIVTQGEKKRTKE